MVECGIIICRKPNGKQVIGAKACGNEHSVDVPIRCPLGTKRHALVHNHPIGPAKPSGVDIRTALKHKVPYLCVMPGKFDLKKAAKTMNCYKVWQGKEPKVKL